jgi:hypothetical protein
MTNFSFSKNAISADPFYSMPQSKQLIETAHSSKKFGQDIIYKVTDTIQNIASINNTAFVNATGSLSELVYLMSTLDTYHNYFVDTLRLPLISGSALIQSINRLLFQLNTYVIPTLTKISATAAPIAAVFGDDNAFVINKTLGIMTISYNNTISLYTKYKVRIETALANGELIDNSNIFQYISSSDGGYIISNTTEIDNQMSSLAKIITGFNLVSQTMKSITNTIESTVQDTRFSYKKASLNFELSVISEQSKHVLATDKMIASLVEKTAIMNVKIQNSPISSSINVTLARQSLNKDISKISLDFNQASDYFLIALNEFEIAIKANASMAAVNTSKLIESVNLFVATEIGKKGTTGIKCLEKDSNGEKLVKRFVAEVVSNATNCLANQTALVTNTSSLVLFKKEDIQLNFMGASDLMCGCLPDNSLFDADSYKSSIECLEKVRGFLSITIDLIFR